MDDPSNVEVVRRRSGIRSPMLAALPRPSTEGRRQRVTQRGTVFLLIGGAILVMVAVVLGRLAPRDGSVGRLLYGLHDSVYLPLKGYVYTAFLPTSLIWWGFGTLLLTLLLASWLSDRSFVRRPHAMVTRWLVGLPILSGWLVAAARWLRRRRLPCDLLLQIVAHEREAAVRHLLTTPAAGGLACRRAIRLTRLAIELHQLPPVGPTAEIQTAAFWMAGVLATRVQRQDALLLPLLDLAPLVAGGLRDARTEREAGESGFTRAAFARDIELLAEIERRLARVSQAGQSWRAGQPLPPDAIPRSRLRALAVSVDARRAALEQARSMIETRRLSARGGADSGEMLANRLPALPEEALPLACQLALDLALVVADLGQAPALAEASLEAVEALGLCLELHAARQLERQGTTVTRPSTSAVERALIGLVEGQPRPEQYAVCARLAAADPHGRLRVWAGLASAEGVVQPSDLELVRERQAALLLAAGPDT